MKKFFSLVLSLVMALSLTTAAWGEEATFDLQDAIDNAKNGDVITLTADFTGDVTVTQKEGVKFTIDGKGKTFAGTITVDGKSATIMTAGITIKNVNFDATSISKDACINMGNGSTATRYVCNLTVDKCTFTGTGNAKAAVKSYTGGDHNLTITGCTVNDGMHSLAQLKNVETGLKITDCKVYSKNGINLNNTLSLEMSGCEFDVKGYTVRFGESGTVNTAEKTFNITDSTLKSACAASDDAVIVFRDSSTYATLTLTDTTLTGTRAFLGNTDQTTIILAGANVSVDEDPVDADLPEDLLPAEKELVENVTTSFNTAALNDAATTIADNSSFSAADIEDEFNGAVNAADVTISVDAYFDVEVTDVDTTANDVSFTLDITPMYQVVASAGADKVTLDEGELEITAPVEITVAIPDALAELAATKDGKKILYVTHEKDNGTTYFYEAVVTGTAGAYTATFTNPNGFSFFTFAASNPVVAVVNGVEYASLQAAVNAAPAAGTVKLMQDCAENVTVGKALTFDFNGYTYTGSVTPAPGYTYMDGAVKQTTTATTGTTSTGSVTTGTVTPVKAKLYRLASVGTSMTELSNVTKIEKTTVTGKIVNDVPVYVPVIYKVDGVYYVQVAKADATYALKNNGAYIYLAPAGAASDANAVIAKFATAVVLDKYVAAAETVKCGDAVKGTKGAAIYMSGNDAYYADGSNWAYFKGEFVTYDKTTKVAFQPHTWSATKVTYRGVDALGHNIPVSVKCSECEKTFDVVGAAKFDNTWVKGVNYVTDDVVAGYYIVLANATSAGTTTVAPSTDKVTSAETFDAGIAMYVGMSVMAAAGSAVVIGKKKD